MHDLKFKSYTELEHFLRTFSTWERDETVYDVGSAFSLLSAILGNLQEKSLPQEVTDYACALSSSEIQFLERLLNEAKRVDHASDTN